MNDIIEEVKLSIELEKKGYDFYTKTASKTKNPLAISTLKGLAEREIEHLNRIRELYQDMSGEKKLKSDWLKDVSVAPSKKELIRPILENLKENLNKKIETSKDIDEAYHVAEGLERESYTLYDKISKESKDQTAKKFYAALAQEEREHYAILEETLKYLNNPGEWYREQERWILEG